MKPTQVTELFANMRKTFVSFFSILMFVALGVGVFVGINWTAPALQNAAEAEFDEGAFHHVQVSLPYGLSQDDIAALAALEDVDEVEPVLQAFATYSAKGRDYTFKLQTIDKSIDKPIQVQGSLPQRDDEIALKASSAAEFGLGIGDTLRFKGAGAAVAGVNQLVNSEYTITALVESPDCIALSSSTYGFSTTGGVDALAWLPAKAFDSRAYLDGFTTVNLRCEGLSGLDTFSGAYEAASRQVEERIAQLGSERSPSRFEEVYALVQKKIEVGDELIGMAKELLAQIDGTAGTDDVAFDKGRCTDVVNQAIEAEVLTPDEGIMAFALIAAADEASREGAGSRSKLPEGADAEAAAFIEAKEAALEAAKSQLAEMKDYDWTVAGRSYNGGVAQASLFSGMTSRLSLSMAALFVIVGLLVSYSAVGRIVHEQITQIGTKKALGLRGSEITASFLAYSALAVVAGAVVGIAVGVVVVEGIIGRALGSRFIMGAYPPYFGPLMGLGVTALELALVLGATWLACRDVLRAQAVDLLRGEKPPDSKGRFYEKWRIWERLPLFTQTIVNNCANDRRRVFSTIVGVAGCTALIVTAITLNDDVLGSCDAQYDNVYGFNAIASVEASPENAVDGVEAALQAQGVETAQVRRRSFAVYEPDGALAVARVVVPADEASFGQLYHVNVVEGAPFDPSAEGAWISQAYASHVGAKVGDELVLGGSDGTRYQLRIAGFYEFYLPQFELVMGRETYESAFGGDGSPNAILADTGAQSAGDVSKAISGTPGFVSLADDHAAQRSSFNSFASLSRTVVLVYLALATLMAIVVLLNLNVMFIEEKKREIITLMINGFSTRDAKRYIYNDTIVLTAVGIVLGLVFGAVMGSVTVAAIEPDTASFFKGIAWRAIAVGAGGSALLAVIMSAIALRRIPRFTLTDINKT